MPRYLITYHGGEGMPTTPEGAKQVIDAFQAWAAGVGDAMIDPGAPLSRSKTLSAGAVVDGQTASAISGYTVIEAGDLDTAARIVETHPFLTRGGTLQVGEAVSFGP